MIILIIDNGTSYLPQLKKLINDEVEVISYSQITKKSDDYFKHFDAVILSGGHSVPVVKNEIKLGAEVYLIKNIKKPIFGICYGFEIIASTFGANLEQMKNKEHGILDIKVVIQDDIFKNIPNFKVFESHRWVVKEMSKDLIPLARSKDGVEAIKHINLPIYGVQFHPEILVDQTCGDEIFRNFISLISRH